LNENKNLQYYIALIILLVLFSPYFITIESLLGGSRLRLLAPLWGLIVSSGGTTSFEIPLMPAVENLVFWGTGSLCILVVLNAINNSENMFHRVYLSRVSLILLLQIVGYVLILISLGGGPPITVIPLPIPVIASLLLTPLILRKQKDLWDPDPIPTK
jgi:hypothetical protein